MGSLATHFFETVWKNDAWDATNFLPEGRQNSVPSNARTSTQITNIKTTLRNNVVVMNEERSLSKWKAAVVRSAVIWRTRRPLAFTTTIQPPNVFKSICVAVQTARGKIFLKRSKLTNYAFRRPFRVCGLDFLFTQVRVSAVKSLHLPAKETAGLARDYHASFDG